MRDNTGSNHYKLYGTVGDGDTDVRKMNIAYDFGVDPRSMALTIYNKTPPGYYYHYWIYQDSCATATLGLLWTVEKYHEPVAVAVGHGNHFISVTGYESDRPAYPDIPGPGTIYNIYFNDPLNGTNRVLPYSYWCNNYFTQYTDPHDPDPATGWYAQKTPHLWQNNWVTVERDSYDYSPDYGIARYGNYVYIIPILINTSGPHDDYTEDNWFSPTNVGSTQPTNWTYTEIYPSFWRAYNHTLSYTPDNGASYSLSFTGSTITWLYTMHYSRGPVQITLDGNDIEQYSAYIPDDPPRWQVGRTWQVANGNHTIQVTNLPGGGYMDLDGFIVDIPTVSSGTYDDTNGHVVYYHSSASDWTHSSGWGDRQYLGTTSWNNTEGDGLRFTFLGSQLTYYYNKAPNQGFIGVVIDGVKKADLDAYSQNIIWDYPQSYSLSYGIHTIELTVLHRKNNASSNYYIELDKFVVQ